MSGIGISSPTFPLTLGVPVVNYAPYAIICWLTLIIVIAFAYLNIKIDRTQAPQEEPEDQQ